MLARNAERLSRLEREVEGAAGYAVDVTDTDRLLATLDAVCAAHGDPEVVVHNAVGGTFGAFDAIDPAALRANFEVNVMALLHLARRLTPAMVAAGRGVLIATGNTSALRGRPNFIGMAPTKAAQRILAESLARDLGPKGVHVGYVVIDAVIDLEWTRKRWPDAPDDAFIQPAHIADEVFHVASQPRSAWSFNVEVRPFRESW
jgi:NADP-dependent 3-hydroxy acid dehydrogenase YdfG